MLDRIQSVLSACRDLAAAAGDAAAVVGEVAGYVADEGIAAARAKVGGLDGNASVDDGDTLAAVADVGPARSRRRVWSRAGHAAIEVRGLFTGQGSAGGQDPRQLADAVRSALSRLHGVRWAEVNAVTAQVLVSFDEGRVDIGDLIDVIRQVESAHGTEEEEFPWSKPAHPSDSGPLTANWIAFAADLAGIGGGIAGRLWQVAPLPAAARVPLALIETYPRARGELEKRIGPVGTDLLLALASSAVYGLSDGAAKPAVDAVWRLMLAGELRAIQAAWTDRSPDLVRGPESSAAAPEDRRGRPRPLPAGPIETYSNRTAMGSLAAAGAVLAATRAPGRAAEALNATVPRAARLGREGFAATVGRDLARRGAVPMDRSVFRRLDRVTAVVIDSAVLVSNRPQLLTAAALQAPGDPGGTGDARETGDAGDAGDAGKGDEAKVWQAASRVLRDLSADDLRGPGPWSSGEYRLVRVSGAGGCADPVGLQLLVMAGAGRRLGEVTVGCEPDPLAEAVLAAARRDGWRLHMTRHASLADLTGRADEVVGGDLAEHVRKLQEDGDAALLVATGDNNALGAADVGVSCLRHEAARTVGWAGDIICGPGLDEVWRLLRAAGRARSVSEHAVALAAAGTTLGLLEATVSRRGSAIRALSPVALPRLPVSPLQVMSLTSLALGAYRARAVAREELPSPLRRTPWHALPADDVLGRLDTERSAADGTDREPAPPGPDRAPGPVGTTARGGADLARAVFSELRDPLTPVLLTGSAASAMLGSPVDAALVGGVMVGNAVISGAQRLRTERALRQLLISEQRSGRRLRREPGQPLPQQPDEAAADLVPAAELRPGDVIVLRSGDVVPADARLLATDSLEVDESALTGESLPVAKDPAATVAAELADRTSMVYDGTTVVSGSAAAVVVAVGDGTEAGRAGAAAASEAAPAGGVSARLSELTSAALPATVTGGLAVTGLGMLRGVPLREALSAGVAVAVAAVPEGLPLVATVAQLAAARRLSRCGVLVRSPRTLEALGRVDVVCFDKTGTLTEGRLEVATLVAADTDGPAEDLSRDSERGRRLLRVAARACPPPGSRIAHATDQAVLDAAADLDDPDWELLTELPFQGNRGFAAALGREGGRPVLAVKGAPEILLDRCATVRSGEADGGEVPLNGSRRDAVTAAVARLAGRGLRVLAIAEATDQGLADGAGTNAEQLDDLARDLTLTGFVAIADVMRPEAADVVKRLAESGVRPVMITGDHPGTASAIAESVAIPDPGNVLTGQDLDQLPERERLKRVAGCSVFARVTPEHKLRIVSDLRKAGHVVAMVGDGANDAAAIRLADVGIGVAARGSTAARNSSDLVLTDGEIGRIGDAVREGRSLWRSVSDAVSILVGGNAGEVTFMVLGTALGGRSPLNTRQLLLVNMLTDMFPALAVASSERRDGDAAEPVSSAPLLTGPLGRGIAVRGGATALGATLAWAGGRLTGSAHRASTMGLAAVVGTQLAQTLVTGGRSPALITTSLASAAALVLMINTPGVSQFFGCTPLGPAAWAIVCASAAAATVASLVASSRRQG